MTLTITGSVETLKDVEFLKGIIEGFQSNPRTNTLYWQGYSVLIAWENYVTGLSERSIQGKQESHEEMIKVVNLIMNTGLTIPRVES